MPISYAVDRTAGLVRSTWSGVVSARDLAQHWRLLLSDPVAFSLRRSLADMREAEFSFTGDELRHLVDTIVLPAMRDLHWTVAMLVVRPDQFGVCRQYQVFAESFSRDSIFFDLDEALHWLTHIDASTSNVAHTTAR